MKCEHIRESLYLKRESGYLNREVKYIQCNLEFCSECNTVFIPQYYNIQYGKNSGIRISNINNGG